MDNDYTLLPIEHRMNLILASIDKNITPMIAFICGLEVATQSPEVAQRLITL